MASWIRSFHFSVKGSLVTRSKQSEDNYYRHIEVDSVCSVFVADVESLEHVFMHSQRLECAGSPSRALWKSRNDSLWSNSSGNASQVLSLASSSLAHWQSARAPQLNPLISLPNYAPPIDKEQWTNLLLGFLKCNFDAFPRQHNNHIGIGWVLRNDLGNLILACHREMVGPLDPKVGEALSFCESLSWTKDKGLNKVIFKSDSQLLVLAVTSNSQDSSYFGLSTISYILCLSIIPNSSRIANVHFSVFSSFAFNFSHASFRVSQAIILVKTIRVPPTLRKIHEEAYTPQHNQAARAGLKLKPARNECFLNIKFVRGIPCLWRAELQLPCFDIDDTTEYVVRNLMALEQCHYPYETYICSYIRLWDFLIDTAEDVDLLVGKKIIVNGLGDSAAVADLVNKLCNQIAEVQSCYYFISEQLNGYYENFCNHTMAALRSVYFGDLWIEEQMIYEEGLKVADTALPQLRKQMVLYRLRAEGSNG
ncbi:hypothetical protein GH714_019092 [Hevea brasiliensis]|uniref:RNase H type-1 domain-containing protein n=1 Tax=Hevea brasiliensis TaxID=3981 RepID=A0A6A6LQ35_HEVBR|nr:hypothetical protein GH714_019092 [Hevea brasiliensis]